MRRLSLLCVLILAFVVVGLSSAQERREDPRENACYDGGDLEGKCGIFSTKDAVEWAWNCGYYYAQYTQNKLSLEAAPETCRILFEQLKPVVGIEKCLETSIPTLGQGYLHIKNEPNQLGNATLYLVGKRAVSSPCDELAPLDIEVVWMADPTFQSKEAALQLCRDTIPSVDWNDANLIGADLPNFNWYCVALL